MCLIFKETAWRYFDCFKHVFFKMAKINQKVLWLVLKLSYFLAMMLLSLFTKDSDSLGSVRQQSEIHLCIKSYLRCLLSTVLTVCGNIVHHTGTVLYLSLALKRNGNYQNFLQSLDRSAIVITEERDQRIAVFDSVLILQSML